RGCALKPEVVEIGPVADGWRESVQYCKNRSLELVSFADAKLQTQIYKTVMKMNSARLQKVWIGMRRSSMTGEWYWVNGDQVKATNWGEGEPGTIQDGQCAIVSLESGQDYGWSDEDCCKSGFVFVTELQVNI
uniref:C-type lectin domain-containing protein n=1 Tax=Sphaeramia orbicularis TaxID=375764 RepID=A0A673ASM9_9TELE